ncbi:MAG: hypothetical protein D6806_16185 [Deltaproteobacteria bacterium]|nr:MAG: hypothetical protein D6806_16185 [Deltaproteobacteria bacterium]
MALLFAFQVAGCHKPSLRGPYVPSEPYRDALERHMRWAEIYNNVDREMSVVAVYIGPALRKLLYGEYRRVFGIPVTASRGRLERNLIESEGKTTFFLFADAADYAMANLEERDSAWKVSLRLSDGKTFVGKVTYLRVPWPNLKALFPFVDEFGRSFLVTFGGAGGQDAPEDLSGGRLVLHIGGAFGSADMSWDTSGKRGSQWD